MTGANEWQRVRLADVPVAPWRNGGGTTRELLAGPGSGDWLWRMSVAEVAQDGPFSRYPGVSRWFVVLDGAGVRLRMDGIVHHLYAGGASLCFDGAADVKCELVRGPTRDFNLMVRGGMARLERVDRSRSGRVRNRGVLAAYAHSRGARLTWNHRSMELPPETLAWRIGGEEDPAHSDMTLVGEDALWMEIAP